MSAGLSFSGGGGDSRSMIPFSPSSSFFLHASLRQPGPWKQAWLAPLCTQRKLRLLVISQLPPYTGMGIQWSLHVPESQTSARLVSDGLYRRQSARAPWSMNFSTLHFHLFCCSSPRWGCWLRFDAVTGHTSKTEAQGKTGRESRGGS
jgi:hypothetical protein